MFVLRIFPLDLRRRQTEVVDLARGARELVAHGLDGAQCGHPRETRLVAYPFVHRLRVLAVKIIVPGLLARADERHAHVLERGQDRGQILRRRGGGAVGLGLAASFSDSEDSCAARRQSAAMAASRQSHV